MTNATDHEFEARTWISNAITAQIHRGSEVLAGVYAGIAQAHATLALAEQQRIANLIAVTAVDGNKADFTKPWDTTNDTNAWRAIRDEVVAKLGIEDESEDAK